jgi:hypothetical protein
MGTNQTGHQHRRNRREQVAGPPQDHTISVPKQAQKRKRRKRVNYGSSMLLRKCSGRRESNSQPTAWKAVTELKTKNNCGPGGAF